MVSETLELIIRTTGAGAASQQIAGIGTSAKAATVHLNSMSDSLRLMRNTLVALSFLRIFEGVASGISSAQQMNNQLIQIARTAADVPKAFAMFSNIALQVHAPVDAVIGLGVQLARSAASYGMSATDIGKSIQTIFNTFRLSGSDPATISNVTKDLKEIFSLNIVQGRQFRAVVLQDQTEALVLSKYLLATGKDAKAVNAELETMRKKGESPAIYDMAMAHKGAFTGGDFARANIAATEEMNNKVSKLPITLAQAFTDLQTRWLNFLNQVQATGAFKPIVDFIESVGLHIPEIVAFAAAVAGLLVFNTVTSAVMGFGSTLSTVLKFALGGFANIISMVLGLTRFVGVLALSFGGLGSIFILIGALVVATFWKPISQAFEGIYKYVQQSGGWFNFLITVLANVAAVAQTVFDVVATVFHDVANWVSTTFGPVLGDIEWIIRKIGELIAPAAKWVAGQISGALAGSGISGDYSKHVAENEAGLKGAAARAQAFLKQFQMPTLAAPSFVTGPKPTDPNAAVTGGKDPYQKQRDALIALEGELAHFAGPAMKFQDDMDKMNNKVIDMMKTVVNSKGHVVSYGASFQQIHDIFAKVGFDDFTKSIDANGHAVYTSEKMNQAELRSLMGLKNTDIDLAQATDLATKALEHHAVTADMAKKYIDKVTLANQLYNLSLLDTADAGRQIALLKFADKKDTPSAIAEAVTTKALGFDQAGDIATYNIQMQQLNILLGQNKISGDAYVKTLYDIQKAYLSTKTDAMSGFQRGLLDIQHTMFDTSGDAAKVMVDSFQGLQDALVTFATTGKISFSAMAQSILKDMDTLIIKQTIMQPLFSMLGLAPGQGGGALPGSGPGGFLSMLGLGSMFGGDTGAASQLGSSAMNPMWVTTSAIPGLPGGGLPGSGGSGGGLSSMFDNGGLFSNTGFFHNLFNGGGPAGSSSGGILSFLGLGGGSGGGLLSLLGFAGGGDFMVGGVGASDSQLVAFRASPDERVTVQTPQQQRAAQKAAASGDGMGGIHLHLHGVQDFDSFKKSKSQVATGLGQLVSRAARRNGN